MRRALASTALVCGASIVALLVAEAVVRTFAPQVAGTQTPGMYQTDSLAGYRLTPGFSGVISNRAEFTIGVRTDEHGLRIPVNGPRSRRGRRILMLGDSFVFGYGVEAEDALPLQIERALEERGDSVSLLNGGVVGYGTVREATWLTRYGMALAPSGIVVGFFLGNDLQDNLAPAGQAVGGIPLNAPPQRWYSPISAWAYRKLHVYALVRRLPDLLTARGRRRADLVKENFIAKYDVHDDSISREEVTATASALTRISSIARSAHVPVLVVLIPERLQVEETLLVHFRRTLPDGIRLDMNRPNRAVAHLLDSLGISGIDLTPRFRDAVRRGKALYLRWIGTSQPQATPLRANLSLTRF